MLGHWVCEQFTVVTPPTIAALLGAIGDGDPGGIEEVTKAAARRIRGMSREVERANAAMRRRLSDSGWFAAVSELCGSTISSDERENPRAFIDAADPTHPWKAVHASHHLHHRDGTIACCRCGRRSETRVSLLRSECPPAIPLGSRANFKRWLVSGVFDATAAKRRNDNDFH